MRDTINSKTWILFSRNRKNNRELQINDGKILFAHYNRAASLKVGA